MLSFDDLIALDPERIWLTCSTADQALAQRAVDQNAYSYPEAQEQAYYNTLCAQVLLNWMQTELAPTLTVELWQPEGGWPSLWNVVNGVVLTVNQARLAIFPSVTSAPPALVVPQEWVDLPQWAAHYYLTVQLDLEQGWLKVVGYASHAQLKAANQYDPTDRTYNLPSSQLAPTLEPLWVALGMAVPPVPETSPVEAIAPDLAHALIAQLSRQRQYSPRLDLPVASWAALIADPRWRRALYDQSIVTSSPSFAPRMVNLGQWLVGQFTDGWQAVQDWTSWLGDGPTLALARGEISSMAGCKEIVLGDCTIELLIDRDGESMQQRGVDPEIGISIQARLKAGSPPLPENVQVSVSFVDPDQGDDSVVLHQELPAQQPPSVIRLPRLLGTPGEEFRVILSMGHYRKVEPFQVS